MTRARRSTSTKGGAIHKEGLRLQELKPESRALSDAAVFDEQLAAMIRFDDPLREAQSESAPAQLRAVAGTKNIAPVLHVDPLARILHIDEDGVPLLEERENDGPAAFLHCVERVADQVLHHPAE